MSKRYRLMAQAAVLGSVALGVASQAPVPKAVMPVGHVAGDQYLSGFYRWTEKLPVKPGAMLREEDYPAPRSIADSSLSKRILYTSTDARWNSGVNPVSGTLHLPKGPMPAGGWPLVAWAHGTLGIADTCAPSWNGHNARDGAYVNEWLKRGYAVVSADYQGLGGPGPHTYMISEAEGRSVLDGIRAVLGAHKDQIANVVFISGQSQGSGAAFGATRQQPTYAPDITLKGTIATGVVVRFADPKNPAPAAAGEGSAYYTILMMVGGSLRDGSPAPETLLTDKGMMLLEATRRSCNGEIHRVEGMEKVTAQNAFKNPGEIGKYMLPSLEHPTTRMTVPIFWGTGTADRPQAQYAGVKTICAAGNNVTWKVYQGVNHGGTVTAGVKDEAEWMSAILAGKSPVSGCDTFTDPGPTTPDTQSRVQNE